MDLHLHLHLDLDLDPDPMFLDSVMTSVLKNSISLLGEVDLDNRLDGTVPVVPPAPAGRRRQ